MQLTDYISNCNFRPEIIKKLGLGYPTTGGPKAQKLVLALANQCEWALCHWQLMLLSLINPMLMHEYWYQLIDGHFAVGYLCH
jgi:hypothetical protein